MDSLWNSARFRFGNKPSRCPSGDSSESDTCSNRMNVIVNDVLDCILRIVVH